MLCSRFKITPNINKNYNILRCLLSTTNVAVEWDNAQPFETLPGPKPLPILGNAPRFLPPFGEYSGKNFLQIYQQLQKQYGNIMVLRGLPGREPIVVTYSVNDIETMYRNEGPRPYRPGLDSLRYYRKHVRNDVHKILGLALSQGDDWWDMRSKVNPVMMKTQSIRRYTKTVSSIADDLIKKIDILLSESDKSELPDDFLNELFRWSLETVCAIALDTRLGCLDPNMSHDSEAQKMIDASVEMFECIYELDILPSVWKFVSTPTLKKSIKVNDFITSYVMKHLDAAEERMKNKPSNSDHEPSILERLIVIDKNVASAMVNDAMIAGIETTSKTVATVMYFLATNPNAQDKLREEINTIWPDSSTDITSKQIDQMLYLRACIKEAQRIAPVTVGTVRKLDVDVVLSGYQIPKGTDILSPNIVLCLSDKHFPQPEKYLPERWLRSSPSELSARNTNMFVYLPFGFGPRTCIGKRLATHEVEVLIAKLFKKYKFQWNYGPMRYTTKLLYEVADPLRFELHPV
uniref:Cytochrome P450 CYP12AS1 n=1 Tax=Chrysoperla zastrowi sillemi TaxID=482137 RepID=A0A9E7YFM5_9NEOP|nr:cytochrome P450 CYP12AS1 [Chrysoperla zastrowi sillemi]